MSNSEIIKKIIEKALELNNYKMSNIEKDKELMHHVMYLVESVKEEETNNDI